MNAAANMPHQQPHLRAVTSGDVDARAATLRTSWSADELMAMRFPDPRWAVPGILAEGVSLLARAFSEGGAHLERLLAEITAEREREEQTLRAQQKVFASVFHPLRGFRQRHGLKYHEV